MRFSQHFVLRAALILTALGTIPGALAQAPMKRVRGEIVSASASSLMLRTRSGDTVNLKLADGLMVTEIVPSTLAAIKPGTFIGTAAVPQGDGSLKALEVQVFPESMRGVGEGHRAWDLAPDSTMTNGTVGSVRVAAGRQLTLDYKGGEQKVFVPPDAPVITYEPGNRSLLTPHSHVIAFAAEAANGDLTTSRVSVGKDGMVPPM